MHHRISPARPDAGTRPARRLVGAALVALSLPMLAAACSNNDDGGEAAEPATTIEVSSTDDACVLSTTNVASGPLTFVVKNDGSKETEFYLYGSDGKKIVAEVEGIGPGTSRKMKVTPGAGTYVTACKPGEKGDGIRAEFLVGQITTQ